MCCFHEQFVSCHSVPERTWKYFKQMSAYTWTTSHGRTLTRKEFLKKVCYRYGPRTNLWCKLCWRSFSLVRFPMRFRTLSWDHWKCGSGKCDTVKIARVENAWVEKAGVDSRGGKCRSAKCGSRQQGWNAGVSRMERQREIILRKPEVTSL